MPATPEEDAADSAAPAAPTSRRHGNGPVFFVLGVLAAAVFTVGWGYALLSYSGMGTGVHHQVISFSIPSEERASITYQVNSRNDAVCVITAKDARHVEIGQARAQIEAGNRTLTTTVETVRRASTVEVASCREQDPQG